LVSSRPTSPQAARAKLKTVHTAKIELCVARQFFDQKLKAEGLSVKRQAKTARCHGFAVMA
jgi:hypothetical protein